MQFRLYHLEFRFLEGKVQSKHLHVIYCRCGLVKHLASRIGTQIQFCDPFFAHGTRQVATIVAIQLYCVQRSINETVNGIVTSCRIELQVFYEVEILDLGDCF
jgi:hypothetical protein